MNELKKSLAKPPEKIVDECRALASVKWENDLLLRPKEFKAYLKIDQLSSLYGTADIFRIFLGDDSRLNFSIPHGINIWQERAHQGDSPWGFPVGTCSPFLTHKFCNIGNILTGKPIILVPPLMNICSHLADNYKGAEEVKFPYESPSRGAKGCMFFLSHSSNLIKSSVDSAQVLSIVAKLRGRHNKVFCVAYYLDLPLPPQLENVFDDVFCCGHALDPCFPARLQGILSCAESVSYNKFGTHAFHAASLSIPVFHYDSEVTLRGILAASSEEDDYSGKSYLSFINTLNRLYERDASEHLRTFLCMWVGIDKAKQELGQLQSSKLLSIYLHLLLPWIFLPVKVIRKIAALISR